MELGKPALGMLVKLYEDDHYLFIHKPAGLSVHSPQRGCVWGVVEAVQKLPGFRDKGRLRSCYRLEKHTSGVLGLAKSAAACDRFGELMAQGRIRRQFIASVRGKYKADKKKAAVAKGSANAAGIGSPKHQDGIEVELIRQYQRRALVRCICSGPTAREVRCRLHAMRLPVVGDAQFDPRRKGRQAGRSYLHLEQVEFAHPFTGRTLRVTAPVPDSFDAAAREQEMLEECLEVALAGRMPFLLGDRSDSFRLIDGKADDVSGLVAEKFGDLVVLQILQGKFQGGDDAVHRVAAWYGDRLGVRAVYAKTIPRDRSHTTSASLNPLTDENPLWGEPVEPELTIHEDGMRFLIRPYDGYLVGLFLDHRENRRGIRAIAGNRRVLNAFAYTCGFSVAAAAGGALSTVSVDVSKKVLEWGKRNFAANDIPLTEHRFYSSDVFDYYKRGMRQGDRFDLIILDPPTFSRTRKPLKVFQVDKDMVPLIRGALQLLDSEGVMLVLANRKGLSAGWIREQVKTAAGRRRCKFLDSPPTPVDFAGNYETKAVLAKFGD